MIADAMVQNSGGGDTTTIRFLPPRDICSVGLYWMNEGVSQAARLHRGGANIVFGDGHVGFFRQLEIIDKRVRFFDWKQ